MSSLKDLRNRMSSVRATQKITRAMQMVAASKLRRAQEKSENACVYASQTRALLGRMIKEIGSDSASFPLLCRKERINVHLLVVCTAERGLCGGFNMRIVRLAYDMIRKLQSSGQKVKIISIGKKGRDFLHRQHSSLFIEEACSFPPGAFSFSDIRIFSDHLINLFEKNEFDACTLVHSKFKSISSQEPVSTPILPFVNEELDETGEALPLFGYEPDIACILGNLVPRALAACIFHALLDNAAGEMASRMMAMDNATRNAGDMIRNLSIAYNRQRQAQITRELIEIISGAEAV